MAAVGSPPVASASSSGSVFSRVSGKLSIVTAGLSSGAGLPTVSASDTGALTPRTPRRESGVKAGFGPRSKQPPPKAAPPPAAAASPANDASTMDTTAWDNVGAEVGVGKTKAVSAGSRRWGLVRKSIVPNPAIMKVNEKVLQIIHTLRKPPEDRGESDIKLLYTWLMNQEKLSSLFTTMSEISAKKLCKEMEFLHLTSGDVVVNQGEKGNTCFILISGLVTVFVRSGDEQKKYHRVTRAAVDGSDARALMEQGLVTFGVPVATLKPGATFGELCLIEPDSKRSATVVVDAAAQVANFIVLTAASYLRLTRSQTIEGTITDHIAFLQHTLLFRKWSKMQLMHLVNSMKLLTIPAGQHIVHKGADADSLFLVLRGEAQECVRIMLHEQQQQHSDIGSGADETPRSVQHCVTVQLTFLGKFDVAGEYLAAEKKVVTCPIDIRAVTDVDCLVLNRKLFNLHFNGKDVKKHAAKALKRLRVIAQQRETWRETRIEQAMQYPNLRVPITRKLMRLSGNCCVICGRNTHVAGDELCMELATYRMEDVKKKKKSQTKDTRAMSKHRISVVVPHAAAARAHAKATAKASRLPALSEDVDAEDDDDDETSEEEADGESPSRRQRRLGHRLVKRQWKAAERAGLTRQPQRPATTPALETPSSFLNPRHSQIVSITREQHVSNRTLLLQQQQARQGKLRAETETEIQRIRASWPYGWRDLEAADTDTLPHFERLYRNAKRPASPPKTAR